MALVEAIRDGRRQLIQMAGDGLIFKEILQYPKLPVMSVINSIFILFHLRLSRFL